MLTYIQACDCDLGDRDQKLGFDLGTMLRYTLATWAESTVFCIVVYCACPDKVATLCLLCLCHFVFKVEQCFQDLDNILIKSLQSVQKVMINDKHCFEMYGYDILLDAKLKP